MEEAQLRKTLGEIDRNQAEVRKLIAEAGRLSAEQRKFAAEQGKLTAEQSKLWRETGFYPFVAGSGFTLALAGLIALLIRLFM